MRRAVSVTTLVMLLTCSLLSTLKIHPVRASGYIYIRADGSIDPPTAPIERNGGTFTLRLR